MDEIQEALETLAGNLDHALQETDACFDQLRCIQEEVKKAQRLESLKEAHGRIHTSDKRGWVVVVVD